MKKNSLKLFFILTALCVPITVMGQDFHALREKAENAVKSKRPDWKLARKEEKENQVVYNWGNKDDGVSLRIFYGNSQEEAAEKMKAELKFLPMGPGKKRTDLGDEAYSWVDASKGFAGVRLRKGNVYIDLVAPSAAMAEDLAKKLAGFVPKK